jgi:RNA polymerase sigma-70 factor (ECF subfamily)
VRLELVTRSRLRGHKEVGRYFTNYDSLPGWRLTAGLVEGRPAALVHDGKGEGVAYAVMLDWAGENIIAIRDFYYARYIMDGAEFTPL